MAVGLEKQNLSPNWLVRVPFLQMSMVVLSTFSAATLCAVFDYQITNSEGTVFNKLLFVSW